METKEHGDLHQQTDSLIEKTRDCFFDNAKLVLIVLVVLGHALEYIQFSYSNVFYQFIYLFHMPAFIFISGYFTKSKRQPKIGKLLLLYVVFQTVYTYFDYLLVNGKVVFLWVNFSHPFRILWFLPALAIWKMVTPFISKYKARYVLPIALVIALFAGYDTSIGYDFSLSRIIAFFPFFLLGHYFDKKYLDKIKNKRGILLACLVIVLSFVIMWFAVDLPDKLFFYSVPYKHLGYDQWWAFVYRLAIMIWGALVALAFFVLIPNRKTFFSAFGQHTLFTYIAHGFIIILVSKYLADSITSPLNIILFYIGVIVVTVLLLIMPNLCKKLYGIKRSG